MLASVANAAMNDVPSDEFDHAPDPAREVCFMTNGVDGHRVGDAAHPTRFDVDPSAGADFNRLTSLGDRVDALVQTDWSINLRLEFGMVNQIVVSQGLFNHRQLVAVNLPEHIQVVQRIGAVAVNVHERIWKSLTYGCEHVYAPAGAEFQFDAFDPFAQGAFNIRDQLIKAVCYAEALTHVKRGMDPTNYFPQRLSAVAGVHVPPSGIERGFSETVALADRKLLLQLGAGRDGLSQKQRGQKVAHDREDPRGPLRAV